MEHVIQALTLVLIYIAFKHHKRMRYIERDITSLQKNVEPEVPQAIDVELDDPKIQRVAELAERYKWDVIDHQENIKMLRLAQQRAAQVVKVNIYYGKKTGAHTYTVATVLKHPKKGKTQLFRKHVTLKEVEQILENPRAHTDKGYYKK